MDLLPLLDELRIHAKNGLKYADDPYDEHRYGRTLDLVSEYYGEAVDLPPEEAKDRLRRDLGYVTPNVGGEAAIFDGEGRILLMKRDDDGTWCLPCGFVDPGESPEETAVREVREETGLDVRVIDLIGVYPCSPNATTSPHGHVAVCYLCEREGGDLELSHEGDALDYREIDEVQNWHRYHEEFATDAWEIWVER
ncbi:MAG: NUDIX hydrolase N-terminal domain-containing protein [Euryarchaeota archaeon]|nr:NUDIX hydrolase N-terminal domain-containing protein [Euryarchaeota archaeon]